VESLEVQCAVERELDCDVLDAASRDDRRQDDRRQDDCRGDDRWMAKWAAAPRLDLPVSSYGARALRAASIGATPSTHGEIAQGDRVELVSRREVMQSRHWKNAFGSEAKDRRYYELIEDTIHDEFDYRYFVVRDAAGEISAVQPCFVLDLDLLVGAKPRIGWLTDHVRRVWPRFMRARTLMVGCAAGEGHVEGENHATQRTNARRFASSIVDEARKLKAGLIVLKEFPAKYRSTLDCFVDADFTRIPSLPNVLLNIDYENFEDYMAKALSGGTRRKLRLKLKASEHAPKIEMSVVRDIAPIIDDVYPLYLAVYERSSLHFEKLTKEYFCGLGHRMADKSRFFIWRQGEKIVAFGSCILQDDTIHAEYLGLDYTVALDLHLYHYTFRDLISWGIANGYKWFHSSALNYDPKLHLRYKLDPLDLYVRHTSPICNAIFARILPWIEPTRYDKTLKQFANYHELWAPAAANARPWSVKALAGSAVQRAIGALKAQSQRLLPTKASGG
jgi:Acetyltransferase (GNAT) domain